MSFKRVIFYLKCPTSIASSSVKTAILNAIGIMPIQKTTIAANASTDEDGTIYVNGDYQFVNDADAATFKQAVKDLWTSSMALSILSGSFISIHSCREDQSADTWIQCDDNPTLGYVKDVK